jgi:hypothetical protein
MIINLSSVKTEALLLFCRDLIDAYENNSNEIYDIDNSTKEFISLNIKDLKKAINVVLQDNKYYIKNAKVTRIKIILSYYNQINSLITNALEKNREFNPSMLCFSLLATWFKELSHQEKSKEFLYFTLYPYGEIFDILIVKQNNKQYKRLNIKMIEIAETTMLKLNKQKL